MERIGSENSDILERSNSPELLTSLPKQKKITILVIRHGIRNPKFIPEGWPLSTDIVQGEGALTERGAA